MPRFTKRRPWSKGARAKSISDRSGQPFPYREMVMEKSTELWVHKSEDDGIWNLIDYEKYIKVVPQGDTQKLKNPRDFPAQTIDNPLWPDGEFF